MIRNLIFFLILCGLPLAAQLRVDESQLSLGTITEAYEIRGSVVMHNAGQKRIYLLRADAEPGLKVYTTKKTMQPGDTALLILSFVPSRSGKFSKNILLVTSEDPEPKKLQLSGDLQKLKTDDRTACYYFGKQRRAAPAAPETPLAASLPETPRDNSNRMAGSDPPRIKREPVAPVPQTPAKNTEEVSKNNSAEMLPPSLYKPNNILILVDISSSMRDSTKLPLMKLALHRLIDAIREEDHVTFVTYADSVKVIQEARSASGREELHQAVNKLKARGMTKGRKAILFSQQLVQKHYITGGNNQIIIASDGEFRFSAEDLQTWKKNQADKAVVLSSVALGNDPTAVRNLKEIARKGNGSFIRIRKRSDAENLLMEEIKKRSRR